MTKTETEAITKAPSKSDPRHLFDRSDATAKQVEEELRREKEVKAEKQARLARCPTQFFRHSYNPIFLFVPSHELSFVRFWYHQKTEVEESRQNEVKKLSKHTFI